MEGLEVSYQLQPCASQVVWKAMRVKMCGSLPQGTRHILCRIQNKFGIVAKHVEFSDTISSAICKRHPFVCIKPARNMAPAANEPQASTTHSRVRLKTCSNDPMNFYLVIIVFSNHI